MLAALIGTMLLAQADVAEPGAVFPMVQAVPLPDAQIALVVAGREVARYHFGPAAPKPYIFPLIGPAGRPVTRLGHPHDPEGHRHHRSVWIGHQDVNGVNFWEETSGARVVHEAVETLVDGPESASIVVCNVWRDAAGEPVMRERRTMTLRRLPDGESLLDVTLALTPSGEAVTLGKTPFGFLGVRVAKTMSVHDGGGAVRNSEGGVNEAGTHWKQARWVDYAGPVTPTERNGVALFDHPSNPRFPTYFHVRDDGWMGAAFCYAEPYQLSGDTPLTLRYRLYVHGGGAGADAIEQHWREFAQD